MASAGELDPTQNHGGWDGVSEARPVNRKGVAEHSSVNATDCWSCHAVTSRPLGAKIAIALCGRLQLEGRKSAQGLTEFQRSTQGHPRCGQLGVPWQDVSGRTIVRSSVNIRSCGGRGQVEEVSERSRGMRGAMSEHCGQHC